jgi:hypothetical protein
MKKFLLIPALVFCAAQIGYSQPLEPGSPEMGFEENKGQLVDENGTPLSNVLFRSRGTGPGIYITTSGLTYVFAKQEAMQARNNDEAHAPVSWSKIEMNLSNASIKKENIVCENELPGHSNFYYAHCPNGILNVKAFHTVTIKNIYPGIDWLFTAGAKSGMAHDFIVHPGADPSQIRMTYAGIDLSKLEINEQDRLVLVSKYGTMYEGGLHVYEKETGRVIKADFDILFSLNVHKPSLPKIEVGYELADFSKEKTLVIDPPLQWSMPQVSTGFDYGYAIAAAKDGSGDVLVTGATDGTDFPTVNAYQGTLNAPEDMVILRLNAAGVRLWSTYYGGSDYEQGKSIASDASGNCYVAGNTGSADFPILNQIQASYGSGVYDAAILKFNSAGVRQFASWYGGLGTENGNAITVDASGNMYITGATNSATFPTLTPLQAGKNIGYDLFIMKINASYVLQWATFFGGDDDDKGRAIAVDAASANIYITGSTLAGGFPVTAGTFQTSSASAYNAEEAFILKMSVAQVVGFATYCGGSDADYGQGIAVDASNTIFITGYTTSSNFPIVNPGGGAYVDSSLGSIGTHDAFIVKCNSTGSTRLWSTYFGGTSPDFAFGIAYDAAAGIYICGNTASTDFPTQLPVDNNYYQATQGDGGSFNDMFIAWFGTNDSLRWSTYYGDVNGNEAYGICVDQSHNIFVTGASNNDLEVVKFGPGFTTSIATAIGYAKGIMVFPNPVSDELVLYLGAHDAGVFSFEIINMQGQVILKEEKDLPQGDHTSVRFNVKELAKGAYFIKMNTSSGASEAYRFIRE